MKRKGGLTGMALVSMALVIALGVMGVGYSLWADEVDITTTVLVGTWHGSLSDPGPTAGPVALSIAGDELTVTITDAEESAYSGNFNVNNTGSVPVKIQSIIEAGTIPAGVTVSLSVVPGDVIYPGEIKAATVDVSGITLGDSFSFTETFSFVVFNQ